MNLAKYDIVEGQAIWGAAWRGITNQHVLLSVGAIGAYIGGVLGAPVPFFDWYGFVGFPSVDFFGVVVFLTAYHLLSGFVSLKVRTKASQSVRKLLGLASQKWRAPTETGGVLWDEESGLRRSSSARRFAWR